MIEHVAVVGAGTMGRGVIWALAQSGITVTFKDITLDSAQRSLALLESDMDHEIDRWSLTKSEKAAILSRVRMTETIEDLVSAEMLIECVPDDLDMKKEVYRELDANLPARQVFITNTSSLFITELAAVTKRPDRFLGIHFSLPVPKRPLVEIIRGRKTSDETIGRARELVEIMGKTAIEVFESPGFVTTRMMVPYLNEAMHIVMEGIATAEAVDTAMRLSYDFPIGPLAMADQMGLDEVLMWMEKLYKEMGDLKYRACPLLRRLVITNRLGVKTGCGFFRYDPMGRRIAHKDREFDYHAGGVTQ